MKNTMSLYACSVLVLFGIVLGSVHAPPARAFLEDHVGEKNIVVNIAQGVVHAVGLLLVAAHEVWSDWTASCAQKPETCKNIKYADKPMIAEEFLIPYAKRQECFGVSSIKRCLSIIERDIVLRVQSNFVMTFTQQQKKPYESCVDNHNVSRNDQDFKYRLWVISICAQIATATPAVQLSRVRSLLLQGSASHPMSIIVIMAICKKSTKKLECIKKFLDQGNTSVQKEVQQLCTSKPNERIPSFCTQASRTGAGTRAQRNNKGSESLIQQFNQVKNELTSMCVDNIAQIHEALLEEQRYTSAYRDAKQKLPRSGKNVADEAMYSGWIATRQINIDRLTKAYNQIVHLCEELTHWHYLDASLLHAMDNQKIQDSIARAKNVIVKMQLVQGKNRIIPIQRR